MVMPISVFFVDASFFHVVCRQLPKKWLDKGTREDLLLTISDNIVKTCSASDYSEVLDRIIAPFFAPDSRDT